MPFSKNFAELIFANLKSKNSRKLILRIFNSAKINPFKDVIFAQNGVFLANLTYVVFYLFSRFQARFLEKEKSCFPYSEDLKKILMSNNVMEECHFWLELTSFWPFLSKWPNIYSFYTFNKVVSRIDCHRKNCFPCCSVGHATFLMFDVIFGHFHSRTLRKRNPMGIGIA